MKTQIRFIPIISRVCTLLLLVVTIFIGTSCKKQAYLKNTIALVYKDDIPYLINPSQETYNLKEYEEIQPIFDEYLMVKKDGKWGFIENTGKEIIKPTYDEVYPMKEKKAIAKKENQTFILNNTGEIIFTFPNQTTSSGYFNENKLVIEKDGLFGYLEYQEELNQFSVLVEPIFSYAGVFQNNLAVVGKNIDGKIKYTYLQTDGTLFYPDFIYSTADSFYGEWAKVGVGDSPIRYQYLNNTLSENGELIYLTKYGSNEVVSYEYATKFENGMAFVANYEYYGEDINKYYKWFSFVNDRGEFLYEDAIQAVAHKFPNDFYPSNPFFLDGTLGFRSCGNSGSWYIYYHHCYYVPDEMDVPHPFYDFIKGTWILPEDDTLIQSYMKETKYEYTLAKSYLQTPYSMGVIRSSSTSAPYAMARITGNKCGLFQIICTFEDESNNKMEMQYIIAPIYDNIIY